MENTSTYRVVSMMVVIGLLQALALVGHADQIVFKNGRVMEVKIMEVAEDVVVFSVGDVTYHTKKEFIEKIERNTPGRRWLEIGDVYRSRQHWDDARHAYQQARVYTETVAQADARLFEVNLLSSSQDRHRRMIAPQQARTSAVVVQPNPFLPQQQKTRSAIPPPNHKLRINNPILTSIFQHAQSYQLDPMLVAAVVKVESNFNPSALSNKGAIGLMQLMPATAEELGVKNPWEPDQNIWGGAKYLRAMLDEFSSHGSEEATRLALGSYYAGPYRIKELGGVPTGGEIERYVNRVLRYYRSYKTQMTSAQATLPDLQLVSSAEY